MKKFQFSLDTVLSFKQQNLEALQAEHAAAVAKVLGQEEILAAAEDYYVRLDEEYREKKLTGVTVAEAMSYQNGLRAQEAEIRRQEAELQKLRRVAEEKRERMVAARQETASLEKLREQKMETYRKEVQKSEENLIDELVSSAHAMARAAAR